MLMEVVLMASQIQIRRDSSANWNSINPILAQGEFGLDLDTNKLKCGDGITAWNSLEYFLGAKKVQLADTGNLFTATDVEGALVEVKDEVTSHMADNVTDANGAHGLEVESGVWTPVLEGSSVAGINTYTSQVGRYTKINARVFFDARVSLSAKDTAMAGGLRIAGLPYPTANIGNYRVSFTIGILNSVAYGAYKQILAVSNENLSAVLLNKTQGTAGLPQTALLPADIGDGFFIAISGTYLTN
jgi:hypothetical protein